MRDAVYTIGHSSHSIDKLTELLVAHSITALADVRSLPYSRSSEQFNRENLQASIKLAGISYVFLGKELGGRPTDRACYVDGKVQYDRLARTSLFQEGIMRICRGMTRYRVALMCAEEDPVFCHRAILVCRHLAERGIGAQHIRENGKLETHDEALARLLNELDLTEQHDLLRDYDALILDAYHRQGRRIAHVDKSLMPKESPREVRR